MQCMSTCIQILAWLRGKVTVGITSPNQDYIYQPTCTSESLLPPSNINNCCNLLWVNHNNEYNPSLGVMLAANTNQEFRNPVGLLRPPEDLAESGFKRASSFKQKKPDHVRLDVTLVRRNSLPSPVTPKMFLAPPEDRPLERVRSFHLTRGGVKNRGDLLRRRSTLSVNSCDQCEGSVEAVVSNDNTTPRVVQMVRLALVGCDEVGIHTLKTQFTTSEEFYMNHHRGKKIFITVFF